MVQHGDFYAELGVPRDSTQKTIKRAYLKLARKFHPDVLEEGQCKESAEARFKRATAAYEVLSDAAKRRDYDAGRGDFGHRDASSTHGYRTGNQYGWAQHDPRWNQGPRRTASTDPKVLWRNAKLGMVMSVPLLIGAGVIGAFWDRIWSEANQGKQLSRVAADKARRAEARGYR